MLALGYLTTNGGRPFKILSQAPNGAVLALVARFFSNFLEVTKEIWA